MLLHPNAEQNQKNVCQIMNGVNPNQNCLAWKLSISVVHVIFYDLSTHFILDPDSKVHGANMGPIWGRQDPGGPHVPCYLGRCCFVVAWHWLMLSLQHYFTGFPTTILLSQFHAVKQSLTHWPLGNLNKVLKISFVANVINWWLRYLLQNCLQVIAIGHQWS